MRKTCKENTKTLGIIGNSLMVLSIIFGLLIYYPIIKEEYNYRTQNISEEKAISKEFSIQIPSIKINAKVIKNTNPWNKNEYSLALQEGVAHSTGSALPYEEGVIFLFAHSSDMPWRMTRTNTPFFRLGKLQVKDEIILTYEGKDYFYKVREEKIVWPNQVEVLTSNNQNQLILQTCTPIGTSLKRLLVFADRN